MYTPVQSFGQQLMRAPDHAEFQLPCLVEDQHGIRLLIALDTISATLWADVTSAGAQGIIRVTKAGFSFAPSEQFTKHRVQNAFAPVFEMPDRFWMTVDWGLDFPAMLQAWQNRYASGDDSFAQMHTHTEFSAFDGYQTMEEYAQRLTEMGQRHMPVTDHGTCAGHPAAHRMADEFGLHAIYGMEAYFVDDRFSREGNTWDYWHLMLWAQDDEGLRNLWGASTESERDGKRGKWPRLDWDTLSRFNSGLMVSTACLGGPLLGPFTENNEEKALTNLARLGDLFGDRLYVELQTTHLPEQIRANQWLVDVAQKNAVPMMVGVDAHYARKEQAGHHRAWIAMQTSEDVNSNEKGLFSAQDYYLHSIDEVREALNYLPGDVVEKAIATTTTAAERCTAEIKPQVVTPVYSKPTAEYPDPIAHDIERFMDLAIEGFQSRVIDKGLDVAPYQAKFEHEGPLLISKMFCGYYLICAEFVIWAKEQGILVGPGRGSGGASIFAWIMRITELDPVEGKLLIDRFMTEGRKSLPDFDIDFPSSRAEEVIQHVQERWGKEHVARVGSHMRLKNKGTFKGIQRALQSELPGESFGWVVTISKIIDQAEASTAGLGLSWDELFDISGDLLLPFKEKMPTLFALAEQFHLRLQTYGKHAAGIIIDPDHDLEAELPMRRGDEDDKGTSPMVTQFDMDALEYLGKVKFDFLRLRNLDTIQLTIDSIEADSGRRINPYEWTADSEYSDPEVFENLSNGWTLGVFQIDTPLGTRVTKQLKPRNRSDLTNIITIGRPGPLRSGLDKVYLRRRDGKELVTYPDPRLEEVLADTYGVMLYQEDIMNICKVLAGYSSDEADEVRKILGKKKVELAEAAGHKFVERAVANNTDHKVAVDLWAQMAEFAKYCVSGDTRISLAGSNVAGDDTVMIRDLYRRLHAPHGPRRLGQQSCDACDRDLAPRASVTICPACRSWRTKFHDARGLYGLGYYADDRIRPVRVIDVVERDEREVITVTLTDGKSITATGNHQHVTDKGYRRVDELAIGDKLLVDAGYESQKHESKNRLTRGERQRTGAVNRSYGEQNYGYIDGGHSVWSRWRAANPQVCAQCGVDWGRIEQAHLDGDHTNNVESNYAWLCASCHKAYDYAVNDRRRRWQKGHLVEAIEIVSIESAGVQQTYDMIMESPHNFVGNGIVSSNSFNRAHAYAYATIGCWTAWPKTHYARQTLTSLMATIKKERIPQFVSEARRLGYIVLPPDINISKRGFAAEGLEIRYGFESLSGIAAASAGPIIAAQPYASYDDFTERVVTVKGVATNIGHAKKLVAIGAFDSLHPNRRALEANVIDVSTGDAEQCALFDAEFANKHNALPCHYDWDAEPKKYGRPNAKTGERKLLKNQLDPPSTCRRKACRQYRPKPKTDYSHLPNYSEEQIREREVEMLGVFLSSSPFDIIPPEVLSDFYSADDLVVAERGSYAVAVVVLKVRDDPKGRDFGFADLLTPSGQMSVIMWRKDYEKFKPLMAKGTLAFVRVVKSDDDRYRLDEMSVLK